MTSATKIFFLIGGLVIFLGIGRFGNSPAPETPKYIFSGSTMGTYFRITLPTLPAGIQKEDLSTKVETKLNRVDALMSTYKPDSEVSRFNRSRSTDWFPVSTETATVVLAALEVYEASQGAFDITIAPLVDLWGFGPGKRSEQPPGSDQIEKLLSTIGSQHLHARLNPPALKKDQETIQIDLSAIAKGFAVDVVAETLNEPGITNYLVDIGGEMRAGGYKENHTSWKIAIERPTANSRTIQTTLALQDTAIATSGDYRNFFELGGKRYSHELDPRNGQPIQHALVSVSVQAASCMLADAWATALIVLGPEQGKVLAEKAGLASVFVVKGGDDFKEIRVFMGK